MHDLLMRKGLGIISEPFHMQWDEELHRSTVYWTDAAAKSRCILQ